MKKRIEEWVERGAHDLEAARLLPGGTPDRLLVNGPCFVERAEATAPEFKRRMFNGTI